LKSVSASSDLYATHARARENDGRWAATALLNYGKRYATTPRPVYFRSTLGPLEASADFLVPLALIPAMVRGDALAIDGPISTKLHSNLGRLQRLLAVFGPAFAHDVSPIEVKSDVEGRIHSNGRGVACFFSGGIDSLFTALTHREELTALVFLDGLDIKVDHEAHNAVLAGVRGAARAIGLPLVEVETNAKTFADRFVHWDLYSGAPLAATALLLQPYFRKFYIAGGRTLATLVANGTHPMLDPLWGTEAVELENDAYAERWEKVSYLAHSSIAREHLRVCFENRDGAYNCCECLKCLWAMGLFAAFGALDQMKTFHKPLDLSKLVAINFTEARNRIPAEDVARAFLKRDDLDPEVVHAFVQCVRNWAPGFGEPAEVEIGSWFSRAWNRVVQA
jgi:hypothetical protein